MKRFFALLIASLLLLPLPKAIKVTLPSISFHCLAITSFNGIDVFLKTVQDAEVKRANINTTLKSII